MREGFGGLGLRKTLEAASETGANADPGKARALGPRPKKEQHRIFVLVEMIGDLFYVLPESKGFVCSRGWNLV
ncbi:hypothetical protein CH361_02155 [Leptospira brenneri]|nr:hypothetical protein CH361_02155 [Leptospira brenneri]